MSGKSSERPLLRRLACGILAAIMTVGSYPLTAEAQEMVRRRNLFDLLFGGPRYEREEPPPQYDRRDGSIIDMAPRRDRNRGSVRATPPTRPPVPMTPPKPEPVAKLENARKILVVGDFLAGNIGAELETTFEASPGVAVITRSDGSSGLVRDDHYNWIAELPGILDETKPAIVVVMLGANDRQQMTSGGKEKFRTDAWFDEYQRRVTEIARIVTARKLPLLWVGLPSFQSPSMMADAAKLNAIYRARTEEAGGEFVDIWDGFVDEDGKFIVTGSDVSGQQVRLRSADGITFTQAGKQKLAFYVEKLARRHLGDMASPEIVNLDAASLPALGLPADPAAARLAQPISLSDPDLDGGKDLMSSVPAAGGLTQSPRDKLVRRGELDPAPAGRVDNYRMIKTQ
ncbi:GDSL-type esterase/lipase family protein [Neorhizobium sp. NCHU2750]|uniref:SGNH/GDSL hydrolase family protein n=1 Tax=Neorhizobium sp. NCHU2750 TaxID=1825976 RepID=UPI000E74D002|nr:lipoprotein [Neorhizobium sp. NCHU2750]